MCVRTHSAVVLPVVRKPIKIEFSIDVIGLIYIFTFWFRCEQVFRLRFDKIVYTFLFSMRCAYLPHNKYIHFLSIKYLYSSNVDDAAAMIIITYYISAHCLNFKMILTRDYLLELAICLLLCPLFGKKKMAVPENDTAESIATLS